MTTFICVFFLDAALFTSNTSCGIIAHNRDDAEKFFEKKVKFAYENLPAVIKRMRPANTDSSKQLKFNNGSSISVGTSLRSDTLQFLHISEYGKTCARHPEKAKEIRTGAINTIQAGCFCFIESTAEGNFGDFHSIATSALAKQRGLVKLTELDFKFFFFPWHLHPEYKLASLDFDFEKETPFELAEYFEALRDQDGIELTNDQKLWYIKKYEVQQDEMVREYPATPEEAFSVPLRGAFYEVQIRRMIKEGRLTKVPYDETIPVHTVWDLGIGDDMSIWFVQVVGTAIHLIDYYVNSDKGFLHYKRELDKKPYYYGKHIGPHDLGARQHTSKEEPKTRFDIAAEIGLMFEVLPKEVDIITGINRTRAMFSRIWVDAGNCNSSEYAGFKGVALYRKDYNEKMGMFEEVPAKGWWCHPSDSLRYVTLAVQEGVLTNSIYDSQRGLQAREAHLRLLDKVNV